MKQVQLLRRLQNPRRQVFEQRHQLAQKRSQRRGAAPEHGDAAVRVGVGEGDEGHAGGGGRWRVATIATLFARLGGFLFTCPGHRAGDVRLDDAECRQLFLHRFQPAQLDGCEDDALPFGADAVIVGADLFDDGFGQGELVFGGEFGEHVGLVFAVGRDSLLPYCWSLRLLGGGSQFQGCRPDAPNGVSIERPGRQ